MRPTRQPAAVLAVLAVVVILAGCAASGGGSTPSIAATADAVPTVAPTDGPTATSTTAATPTAVPTRAATPVPTEAGPVVLESTVYPYRITVTSGQTSFVPTRVPWDGAQKLSSDSRETDRARAAGLAIWLAMTDTADDIDAVATDYEAKFRSWHGCLPATGRREFAVGELKGVGWIHRCANGAQTFARAVVVGDGHALVAYAQGPTVMSAALDQLIELFGGLEWTAPE